MLVPKAKGMRTGPWPGIRLTNSFPAERAEKTWKTEV